MLVVNRICGLAALLALLMTGCAAEYEPVATFAEADDPVALTDDELAAWSAVGDGINAQWASVDLRYSRSRVPAVEGIDTLRLVAWRGERASAQLLLWSGSALDGVRSEVAAFSSAQTSLPATIATTRFVRYTLADDTFRATDSATLVADMLDTLDRFDIAPRSVRPVWLTIAVPEDAVAGVYTSHITLSHNGEGCVTLPLSLEVQDHTLPTPDRWNYHLDLWQHPTTVARAEGVELWSDAHFEALRRDMSLLAAAGQKVITATLNKDPWNHQCYDAYEPMIVWTLSKDGTWHYDYAHFDRWVELMLSLGINKMINCYSMVPWNCELEYFDEASGEVVTVVAKPDTPAFAELWRPFLLDFKRHLSDKGWLSITNIAMDERSPEEMDAAVKLLAECAPEMGFAIADMHKSYRRYLNMRDVCVAQEQAADHADILMRRAEGFNTTFYICCNPLFPNTFTYSNPFEAELMGWYALSCDYDGMLRWAYNSWPANPEYDSRFGNWSSGDTYLIYPYARSSIRFERLIDGIEIAEKVRILRAEGVDTDEVEEVLDMLRAANINDPEEPWLQLLTDAREALNSVSRQ